MIKPVEFDNILRETLGVVSYFGVPDSVLTNFCRHLVNAYDISNQHVVGVNEGNCVALAAGVYLATGKPACVYMQNSGLGNAVNPILSLTSPEVYNIPAVYVIGWRGAPGETDEPQHMVQGKRTIQMLELLDIAYVILDKDSTAEDSVAEAVRLREALIKGSSVAFLIKKGTFISEQAATKPNECLPVREMVLKTIMDRYPNDIFVGTTGVTSREMFEIREKQNMSHVNDFLTVGSMGHSSAIALGVAKGIDGAKRVWSIDGDGAALMHMGAMATIGSSNVSNFVHIVLNNFNHESVGCIPTSAVKLDFCDVARACGYEKTFTVNTLDELLSALDKLDRSSFRNAFMEIRIRTGTRADLGRPTISPSASKELFMRRHGRNSK